MQCLVPVLRTAVEAVPGGVMVTAVVGVVMVAPVVPVVTVMVMVVVVMAGHQPNALSPRWH